MCICLYIYIYIYIYTHTYTYICTHVRWTAATASAGRRSPWSRLPGRNGRFADRIGTPDPNPKHLVNWRF